MKALLTVSRAIDVVNERLGLLANWMILIACVISAGNAMIRYAFDLSARTRWLEVQWYMFAVVVMLGASYTLRRNEHVRVDILYLHLSERGQLMARSDRHAVVPDPVLLLHHRYGCRGRSSMQSYDDRARCRPTPAVCCAGRSRS